MDELKSFLEGIGVPVAMSLFGGIAKTASQGWKSWKNFIGSSCVSVFAGMVVHLFIQDANLSSSMKAGLAGLSGYSGVVILDGLTALTLKMLEKITGQKFGKSPWDGTERRKRDRGDGANDESNP